ncbi:MAG: hypothetical protein HOQ32_00430 [Lysobacter sp.]|nr:hypothetical protein [Lysobacter sp.]
MNREQKKRVRDARAQSSLPIESLARDDRCDRRGISPRIGARARIGMHARL